MPNDQHLLQEYARDCSESAFAEIVRRHIDLVYSAALRETRGDTGEAQDLTQAVFVELARKAGPVSRHPAPAAWLYTCVRRMAANVRRANDSRQRREQEDHTMKQLLSTGSKEPDWKEIQPVLDDSMHELGERERAVVVLRFFEGRSHKEVGAALGLNESAARKRVDRALERLRHLLAKRGVTSTVTGLAMLLTANAVGAVAPAGLAAGVTSAALAGSAGGGAALTIFEIMSMSKIKAAAIGAITMAGLGTTLVIQQQSVAKARGLDADYQRQAGQLAALQADQERLASPAASSRTPGRNNREELQKLRDEMAALSAKTNEVGRLRQESRQAQAKMKDARILIMQDLHGPELQKTERSPQFNNRLDYAMRMNGVALQYMREHNDEWPTNTDQLAGVMSAQYGTWTNFTGIRPDQFEIVYEGPTPPEDKYGHPGDIIRIREKVAWQNTDGKWVKVYGMLSGQGMTHVQTDPNFDEWERRRIVPPTISKQ